MATTTNFGWNTPDNTDLVKDGALAIRTLGSAIDTSMADLRGGTTGQILAKQSNAQMDFEWINNDQGDITAVTAGTGISGGGTSGAVTITNSMATAIDAKGDLIVGTGADTFSRLAVGATNGHVLTVDSAEATGMKWASAAGSFVGVSLYKTATQTVNNTTDTLITFDAEDFDTDAYHSNTTNNSRITIPSGRGGKYRLSYSIQFPSDGVGAGTASLILLKNGATYMEQYNAGASWFAQTKDILVDTVATDYWELRLYHNAGSSRIIQILGNSRATSFSMQFLGA